MFYSIHIIHSLSNSLFSVSWSTEIEQEHDKYVKKYLITLLYTEFKECLYYYKNNIIRDIDLYGLDKVNDNSDINNYIANSIICI